MVKKLYENIHSGNDTENPYVMPSVPTQESYNIPDKFKNPQTGELKTDELLKSYLALEKKLGERSVSGANIHNGFMPSSPDEYQIEMKNELLTPDAEINQKLFDLGFTNEQVQAVYDLAAEKVIPMMQELCLNYKSDQELAALEKEFGGADQFNTMARQISAWGEKNLKPEIYDVLSSSKDGIMTMYKMMTDGTEPSVMKNAKNEMYGDTEESLKALMRDPNYWKKQDPALVKRVEEGFKRLYK